MSQYVSTENEEMVQVASNLGWSDLCDWARRFPVETHASLHHLIAFGYENDAAMLAGELRAALAEAPPTPDVRDTALGLIDFLADHPDAEIIIVGDGLTTGDDDDDRSESKGWSY